LFAIALRFHKRAIKRLVNNSEKTSFDRHLLSINTTLTIVNDYEERRTVYKLRLRNGKNSAISDQGKGTNAHQTQLCPCLRALDAHTHIEATTTLARKMIFLCDCLIL
jgi:hypothetical protein